MAKRKTARRAKAKPANKPVARPRKEPKAKAKPAAKKALAKPNKAPAKKAAAKKAAAKKAAATKTPAKKAPANKAPVKAKAREATPRIVGITDTGGMISINLMSDHVVEDAGGHALETGMSDVVSIEVQAEAALESGDTTRALRLYSGLIETSGTPLASHLVARGRAYYHSGDYEAAIGDFERGLAIEPRFPDLYFDKGKAELQAGRVGDADASFTIDLEIDPSPISFYNRHLARKTLGDREGALADLDRAIVGMPDEVALRVARAMLRAAAGDLEGALVDVETAVRSDPSDITLHERCGRLALGCGRPQRAVEAYAFARRITVEAGELPDVEHLGGEALALGQLGRHADALALLDQALSIAPDDPTLSCNRGWMRHLAGRDLDALVDLDRAIAIDPGYAKALQNRAAIHTARGDRGRALADYRRLDELGHDVREAIARLVAP